RVQSTGRHGLKNKRRGNAEKIRGRCQHRKLNPAGGGVGARKQRLTSDESYDSYPTRRGDLILQPESMGLPRVFLLGSSVSPLPVNSLVSMMDRRFFSSRMAERRTTRRESIRVWLI